MQARQLIVASLALVCSLSFGMLALAAEPAAGEQVEQSFKTKDGAEVPYLLYLPKDFDSAKARTPVMLFLHGRGESDGPVSLVAKWGPPQLVAEGQDFPFLVVSPQCPREDSWSSDTQQTRLVELLDHIIEKYRADTDRVYLAGLSMGGSGSWRMAADHPQLFAAVVPICGRGNVENASKLKDLPIWVFVGDQDRVFNANVEMVDAIRNAGSKRVRLTTLEHIGHNSWSAAFASPDLYAWLQEHTRGQ